MSVEFNKEYELGKFAYFSNEKINAEEVSQEEYISTENMVVDRGGVEKASKLPSVSKFNSFQKTDTLFSNIRTYFRKVWMASFDGGASADVLVFRTKDTRALDPAYLYYLISNKDFADYSVLTAKGVKMPRGDKTAMMQYKFLLPDPEKQSQYASVLKSIDDKIENNRRMNETLEGMAQAIFKSWFVDFDPVHAKVEALKNGGNDNDARLAAMRAISSKTADGLAQFKSENPDDYAQLATTADAFPSSFTDSALGNIPKGWEISEIGNEVDVVGGGTPSTKNDEFWENGHIHWTTPKDLSNLNDKTLVDTERKVTEAGLKKISSGLLPVDTVLMSSRAPVGYLALAKVPVAINQGYIAMKCTKALSPEYVVQWCNHNMDDIKQRASGTTFAEISKKSFKPIPVIVPSLEALNAYSKNIGQLYLKIEKAIYENRSLVEIRDSLLPRLLSGELSVDVMLADEE